MESEINELKENLKHIEKMKIYTMRRINTLGGNEESVVATSVYPMAKVKPMLINGYPVFQFSYDGALPAYKDNDRDYLALIRHYYCRATFDSYDFSKVDYKFDKSVIITAHYFNNMQIRDLDNRNRKLIQDAIRQTGLIGDDSWSRVWNVDVGFLDPKGNHVQVYVVSQDNFSNFMSYLQDEHWDLLTVIEASRKETIIEEYKAGEIKKTEIVKTESEEKNGIPAAEFWG